MSNRSENRSAILEAIARVLYVEGWCSMSKEGEERLPSEAPEKTSRAAHRHAAKFVRYVEYLNKGEKIEVSYERALAANVAADSESHRQGPDDFGHDLAMQAWGHGVGWTDNNAEFSFILCEAKFYGSHGEIDCRWLSNLDGSDVKGLPFGWTPEWAAREIARGARENVSDSDASLA